MVEVNPSAPDPHRLGPGGKRHVQPKQTKFDPKAGKKPPALPGMPPNKPFQVGKGWGAYKTWLGPEGYKKFQSMLCQNISHQMGQAKIKEQKRKEIMKKSIEGKTDIYD